MTSTYFSRAQAAVIPGCIEQRDRVILNGPDGLRLALFDDGYVSGYCRDETLGPLHVEYRPVGSDAALTVIRHACRRDEHGLKICSLFASAVSKLSNGCECPAAVLNALRASLAAVGERPDGKVVKTFRGKDGATVTLAYDMNLQTIALKATRRVEMDLQGDNASLDNMRAIQQQCPLGGSAWRACRLIERASRRMVRQSERRSAILADLIHKLSRFTDDSPVAPKPEPAVPCAAGRPVVARHAHWKFKPSMGAGHG
ncbi:MAG TPA: hypothetical protein VGO93_00050 [Candidatus Xenobia bacterium]|jgi:hypothetical protein